MAYERIDTDNQLAKLKVIVDEALLGGPNLTPSDENIIETMSQGVKGDSFGQVSGLKSDTPFVANLTDLDEDGITTGITNRINLSSSLTIVDYSVPVVTIDLKFINFKPAPGTHVKFTPKVGRTLVIQTAGDFTNTSDITITDDEYIECVFYDATESGIAGGGFKPLKVGTTGGGGEFFGPWTADHDAGGFDLFGSSGVFLSAALTTGILFNAGGVGLIAPAGDTIDVFINNLVTPKFGFTETSLETNVNLNFANPTARVITNLGLISFEETGQDILSASTGIRHDVPTTDAHRFRVNLDEKMQVNQVGTTFFENVELIDNAILTIFDQFENFSIQMFQNAPDASESVINVTDHLVVQIASTEILEILNGGIIMRNSNAITLEDVLSSDTVQYSILGGDAIINYTGDFKIKESGADVLTLGGLIIQANRNIDMLNHTIDNIFTAEIEENFTAGGVPTRPVNGSKLFTREQFGDATKRELRVYFPTGNSQLLASEPP